MNGIFTNHFKILPDIKILRLLKLIEDRKERNPSNQKYKGPAFEYADVDDDAYNDGKLTDYAIKTLKDFKGSGDPFFLAVGYISTHLPFIQPKKYGDLYDDDDLIFSKLKGIPKNAPKRAAHKWSELRNAYLDIPQTGPVSSQMERDLINPIMRVLATWMPCWVNL